MPHSALESALAFLRDVVGPQAQAIDQNPEALRAALGAAGRQELLALKRPTEYGGPGIDEAGFRRFQEEAARASGSFAFLQTQHQSAGSMLLKSENDKLKLEYLPKMASGERLVGIGFSQLRRTGPPILVASPDAGGYRLDGTVPWVTGWSFFPEFLVGASLPDGRALFAIVPLSEGPDERISAPMRLAAMESAMTVSVQFSGFAVPAERVAFIRPAGWIAASDMLNIALQGHFAIGCALAGLDVLEQAHTRRPAEFLAETSARLGAELEACRAATAQAQVDDGDETTEARLQVRAWAVDLAFRCAQAAVVASSGGANALTHPAQRIYREALVYSVSAQTSEIMRATLARIPG